MDHFDTMSGPTPRKLISTLLTSLITFASYMQMMLLGTCHEKSKSQHQAWSKTRTQPSFSVRHSLSSPNLLVEREMVSNFVNRPIHESHTDYNLREAC